MCGDAGRWMLGSFFILPILAMISNLDLRAFLPIRIIAIVATVQGIIFLKLTSLDAVGVSFIFKNSAPLLPKTVYSYLPKVV